MSAIVTRIARRFRMTTDAVQRVFADLLLVLRGDDQDLYDQVTVADPIVAQTLETRTLRSFPAGRFGQPANALHRDLGSAATSPLAVRRMMLMSGVRPRMVPDVVGEFVAWVASLAEELDVAGVTSRSPSLSALLR